MYGVPNELDLQRFEGDYLTQICIGTSDIQFRFGKGSIISVWSHWELRDATGALLDQAATVLNERECYKVHVILGASVAASAVNSPRSFTLVFENRMSLTVFDDSAQYESFSIQPGDIFV